VTITHSLPKASPAETKCPLCKGALPDSAEYEATSKELEKIVSRKHLELSREERKEFEKAIQDLKVKERNETKNLKRILRDKEVLMKKNFDERLKKEKDTFAKKISEMKKNHQINIQDTRDIYERQALLTQKEQEKSLNGQLKEIMQNYASLTSSYQKEMEKMRKMQEDHEGVLRKKEGEIGRLKIELAKSSSDLQIRRLVVQLGERNAAIEQLQRRIRELESVLDSSHTQNRPLANKTIASYEHEEGGSERTADTTQESIAASQRQKDLRDEFMTAIKEITREHRQSTKDDTNKETSASNSASDSTARQGSSDSQSKMDRMRSFFT
jgi:DNA repair exonuclease SbcCD ATPase subunit